MKNILEEIVSNKHQEIAKLKSERSLSSFSNETYFGRKTLSLRESILGKDFGVIAEIKRKSPSGGDISNELSPTVVASEYQSAGAAAISVLTDLSYFGGSIQDILSIRPITHIPILRKEFILDEIQLFEAKAAGADAILLIAAILEQQQAHHLTIVAQSLGLEVLFEVHSLEDLTKLNDEIDLVAVNNRDLAAQITSLEHSRKLARFLPHDVPKISASGISSPDEIIDLQQLGYNGALIGESVLRNGHLDRLTGLKLDV